MRKWHPKRKILPQKTYPEIECANPKCSKGPGNTRARFERNKPNKLYCCIPCKTEHWYAVNHGTHPLPAIKFDKKLGKRVLIVVLD